MASRQQYESSRENENMVEGRMILMSPVAFFTAAVFFVSVAGESAEDIVGCGGFLKTPVPIDFSQVFIKLYTKQGILKELSDCAPTNGYYFIPIYDKGEYSLKLEAPKGWYFEPEVVHLNFDGVNDPCSKASDINFTFKGFAVQGKVTSRGSKDGPDNVSVVLTSEKDEKTIQKTKTKENGSYEFKAVEPGNYIVKVKDERYILSKGAAKISVKSGNFDLPPDSLIIAGYELTGEVLFEGEPIKGVNIVLYGNDDKTRKYVIPGCSTSPLPELKHRDFMCHVTSDEKGMFKISPIPPGIYSIRPHYIKFDVQPQVMNIEIRHGHLNLMEKFLVKGFGVSGRVMSPNGKGIDKADIYLNGELVTKTDGEGKYNLDSIEPGNYLLQVHSDALKFTDLNLKLTPNKPEIDAIYPSEFRVCGKVTLSGQNTRFVEIRDKKRGQLMEAATNRETGAFCHFLKPGTYTLNVKISDFEKSKGLQYLPTSKDITVDVAPINDIEFSQLRGKVTGKILKLSPADSVKGGRLAIKLKSQNSVIAMKTLERSEATYAFIDVMPGDYDIEIQSDNWCFKNQVHSVSVTSSETYVPDFVQSGFKTRIISSHETKAFWRESRSAKSQNLEITLAKGENTVCLPNSTTYEFEPFGCHGYEKTYFTFNPLRDDVLRLNAITHEVSGFVMSSSLVNDLFMNITYSNGEVTRIGPLKGVSENNRYKYRFSYKFKENQSLKFSPSSENILFQPEVVEYKTRNECAENEVQFMGEKGLIVEGRIEPPLGNVKITLKIFEANTNTTELVQVTQASGTYKFGPLKNTVTYEVTAAKESYVFTGPNKNGVFSAHKLAEINVKVMDNSTKEPLHGVLLSLTGGEKYRKNSMTEEDGSLTFHSLSPGEYFLRPMMKEYKFEPSSQIIQIKEGVTEQIELKGRRVSFSAYGVVSSLNGEAEGNVLIEAVGIDACSNLQEETLTEANGQFRIRGLLPHCEYYIRLKSDSPVNAHIHRINPHDLIVKTNQGDIRDIKLIAFELVEHTDLSILVESTIPEHLKTLRLKLCKEDTPESPVHVVKLDSLAGGVKHWGNAAVQERFLKAGLLVQLPFVLRDKTPYFIQLDSSLNKHTYTYKEPVVHFIADRTYRNFKIVFDPVPKVLEHEFSSSNYFIAPLLVMAALLYKYSNRAFGAVQNFFGMFNQNSFNFSYQDRIPYPETGIHDVTIEPVAVTTKRKTKPRKT